jgi:hypothetical protein
MRIVPMSLAGDLVSFVSQAAVGLDHHAHKRPLAHRGSV